LSGAPGASPGVWEFAVVLVGHCKTFIVREVEGGAWHLSGTGMCAWHMGMWWLSGTHRE